MKIKSTEIKVRFNLTHGQTTHLTFSRLHQFDFIFRLPVDWTYSLNFHPHTFLLSNCGGELIRC